MKIWDRSNNIYIEEIEPDKKTLEFLYNTVFGRLLLKVVSSRLLSSIYSLHLKNKKSISKIDTFVKEYNINLDKYQKEEYKSFNDFFIRKKIYSSNSNENELIAVADSKLSVYTINSNLELLIKNIKYSLSDLLDNSSFANEYENGICLVYRLTQDDCHRYIFFDSGKETEHKYIRGKLHTVRPISSKYKVFSQNSREYSVMQTRNFGQVVQIEVGALLVGKIVNYNKEQFNKLDEKGYFEYGGSTIIQLFKENTIYIDEDIINKSKENIETKVEIGERIGGKL